MLAGYSPMGKNIGFELQVCGGGGESVDNLQGLGTGSDTFGWISLGREYQTALIQGFG